jgi:aminomethyltransferase
MGQLELSGSGTHALLQRTLANDLDRIEPGRAQYTLLLNEAGCPIDDLIAYRLEPDRYLLVVNAARRERDRDWLAERVQGEVRLVDRSQDFAMIALQGPHALELVELPALSPFAFTQAVVAGVSALVARTGYTGEPGVELLVDPERAGELWDRLLAAGAVPAGLGARDTLRLEVCYPLYGNDLSESRTALEAGLGWVCALDRKEDFLGAEALRRQREEGGYDRLVAFRMEERGIPRQGMAIAPAGEVTSGTMSPSLGVGIGMGYVPAAQAEPGSGIEIDVRGRSHAAKVARKPLYSKEAGE